MTEEAVTDLSDHYCVIGAGPGGLLAARSLKRAGIPYQQFDKNPDVGGIWDIGNDWSPMYESAHFISSKHASHLPGFPMPEAYPDYPDHRRVFAYLQAFARAYDLYGPITFNTTIVRATKDDGTWIVELSTGERRRYRGLFVCSGNTWDPSLPDYPGTFTGESLHSVRYRDPELFRGKRVLVIGGGNSGCDIACDAAIVADHALLSLRRGYHFIPKYIMGEPADVFGSKVSLPRFLQLPLFTLILRVVVGDLRGYGLPKPDHKILESHPIVNTQVLHHLGHGDLEPRGDVERFDGRTVHFKDGRSDDVDLIVFATGYKVTYPFLDRDHFEWVSKYPELYLSSLHREYDNVCCLGLHQTDGGAFDSFATQADMMCNFILDQDENPKRAQRFHELKATDRPNLSGGVRYVNSPRHATYVKNSAFKRYCARMFRRFSWRHFSLEDPRSPAEAPASPGPSGAAIGNG